MKGMIIETVLSAEGNSYPFDEEINPRTRGLVEELQTFASKQLLVRRRGEVRRHMKVIQSNFIIQLLKIYEQELTLHYIYEYVPFSLSAHIRRQLGCDQNEKFKQMTAKLLLRKLSNEVTAIAMELAKFRIETEFHYRLLGVENNKIKIYINCQHQVGRKSELLLREHYRNSKEIAIRTLEAEFAKIVGEVHETPNFIIRGNRLLFNNIKRQTYNNNFAPSVYSDSNENSFCLNDSYVNCETKDSNANTKEKERRYSQTKWDASEWRKFDLEHEKLRNTQSPAFINDINLDSRSKMGESKHFEGSNNGDDDNFDGKSYLHSKSIRIQLQKNKDRRRRKDSYKVKVITTHQYEMDDINPKDLFQRYNMSDSSSFSSDAPKRNKHRSPKNRQFQQKVKKAAEKASELLHGYLHKRRHSRK